MESYKIENLTFTYPNRETQALSNINFSVSKGEFITIIGKSGCGKTTLLRLLKSSLAPFGKLTGNIYFNEKPLSEADEKEQAGEIGFVMQNPDNQIVTDKVWHELAFGLESLGVSTPEIRTRVSEMASFFGIQTWFHKKTTELSGGQKQILNLASVMAMQPSVLILDEPTNQLDPISAQEFLKTLEKINQEIGTTIILTEHRLEDAFPISDRIIVMDSGKIIADSSPREVGRILKNLNHDMYDALPTPMRVCMAVEENDKCPVTVREGRWWLENFAKTNVLKTELIPNPKVLNNGDIAIELKDVWFRYDKNLPDVIKGLSVKVKKSEFFAIMGGNGTGKTTALSLISGLNTPYRGKVLINGLPHDKLQNLYNGILGVLPQNPQALFVKKSVLLDLMEILPDKISNDEKMQRVKNIAALCRIEEILDSHPYDLSGGEQQRAALAKVLLNEPEILLLDEPTKGMDAKYKECFADILNDLKSSGVCIVMVSHDIEFCAQNADRCALFFDGAVTSEGVPREFFSGKNFYTTAANRMARTTLPDAVLADDIILSCGGRVKTHSGSKVTYVKSLKIKQEVQKPKHKKLTPGRIVLGIIFTLAFVLTCIWGFNNSENWRTDWQEALFLLFTIFEASLSFACFFPQRELGTIAVQKSCGRRKLSKRTLVSMLMVLIAIPLTIFIGIFYLGDKKYYFISLLIILEIFVPFCMAFESRKPQARELIVISVLCAIAVAGRGVFYMLPQFKPVAAIVIIAGVCFGGEAGFLVGAVTAFVSNLFFGQGPWTPWQMFAFGMIGFFAGILFRKGFLRKTKASLCIFGGIATFLIYGGITNLSSVILWDISPAVAYLMAVPFDLVHAVSSVFFLWFITEPMIDKIDRIKTKYGL